MGGQLLDGVDPGAVVDEERARILSAVLDELPDLTTRAVAAMRKEIPAYADCDERAIADVRDQVHRHFASKLAAFLDGRLITLEDISFVRAAATRRARAGFALEDYVNAFRVGQKVFWEAVVTAAGDTMSGHEAALELALPLMRYCDFASTHAAHAYVEFTQHELADADRDRRDLLEELLEGRLPERGPLVAVAHGFGLSAGARMVVAVGTAVDPAQVEEAVSAASAAMTRVAHHGCRPLVVARHGQVIAVPALPGDVDAAVLDERFEAVHDALRREGLAVGIGISTVADGVAELPRAYREARGALEALGGAGGVAPLGRLSAFDYLSLRADDTARRLVDPELRTFLDEDRERGLVLTATIRAFADADCNLRVAAERLQVHPNTAQYRLRRIEERTGKNPRCIADLVDMLVAIALDDAA
jgi:PucR C-terminal helix-turn-helix domain/GGDEF-like domain